MTIETGATNTMDKQGQENITAMTNTRANLIGQLRKKAKLGIEKACMPRDCDKEGPPAGDFYEHK